MENSRLTTRILMEIERLIDHSLSVNGEPQDDSIELHHILLKKYYNAASVQIDYHRHRITMDIIINDEEYDHSGLNLVLTTVPANIHYDDLNIFLRSCLEVDIKSLAFYSRLIQHYTNANIMATV